MLSMRSFNVAPIRLYTLRCSIGVYYYLTTVSKFGVRILIIESPILLWLHDSIVPQSACSHLAHAIELIISVSFI